MFRRHLAPIVVLWFLIPLGAIPSAPAPPERKRTFWPMFGGTPGRNMVNLTDRNVLDDFDPDTGEGILWIAALGSKSHSSPVVAGGKIYIGTNNDRPRNPRDIRTTPKGEVEPIDRGILMCFDERTGKFLWQAVHTKLETGQINDWPQVGIASSPAVENNRVYYVSNRAEVVCVDANGFADGNQGFQWEQYKTDTDADILWSFDMIKELKVFPHNLATCSPLIVGDIVFVVTANGVDDSHENTPNPDAPSFIALDKNTGKLLWKDNSPGKKIMHGQWAMPSYTSDPVPQVIFPGGDGWLRAFDPPTGKLLWKFDGNPKTAVYELGGVGTKSDFVNVAPVVVTGRVYIAMGQDPEHGSGIGHLWCIDLKCAVEFGKANKDADVSPVKDNFDPKAEINKQSALAWHYGGENTNPWANRDFVFGRSMSCACVVGDVLYIGELDGYFHCFHARTGEHFWQHDTKASIWGSPLYADGKVFLATDSGDLFIYRHKEKPDPFLAPDELASLVPSWWQSQRMARLIRRGTQKQIEAAVLIRKIELDSSIRSSPTVANGVLYVNTEKTLYAIGKR